MTDTIPCLSCREPPGWISSFDGHTVIFCGNEDCPDDDRLVMGDTAEAAIRRWNEQNAP